MQDRPFAESPALSKAKEENPSKSNFSR